MAEQVLDILENGNNAMENVGTTETILETTGIATAGTTAIVGAALDSKKSSHTSGSTKIHPTEHRPRRRISRMRSFTSRQAKTFTKKLHNLQKKHPNAIFGRVKQIVPGFFRMGFRFDRIL